MTAQTQIIQTTSEAHAKALADIIEAHRQMSLVTDSTPAAYDDIDIYCDAYAAGWKMATYFILSRGNTAFERSE